MKQELEEQLSAFVDGELDSAEAELLLRRLGSDEALRERVRRFQLIGSSLRSQPVAGPAFLANVHEALDAPIEATPGDGNPRSWRRLAAGGAMAAAVALIALVGLNFAVETNQSDAAPQVAGNETLNTATESDRYTVPTPSVASGNQALVEPRLVNYMMRHGQLGPVITRAKIQPTVEPGTDDEEAESDADQR